MLIQPVMGWLNFNAPHMTAVNTGEPDPSFWASLTQLWAQGAEGDSTPCLLSYTCVLLSVLKGAGDDPETCCNTCCMLLPAPALTQQAFSSSLQAGPLFGCCRSPILGFLSSECGLNTTTTCKDWLLRAEVTCQGSPQPEKCWTLSSHLLCQLFPLHPLFLRTASHPPLCLLSDWRRLCRWMLGTGPRFGPAVTLPWEGISSDALVTNTHAHTYRHVHGSHVHMPVSVCVHGSHVAWQQAAPL